MLLVRKRALQSSSEKSNGCVQKSPERAAILDLIESYQQDGHLYDADYVLRAVAAAIKARGEP
jgi:hypothetical protein